MWDANYDLQQQAMGQPSPEVIIRRLSNENTKLCQINEQFAEAVGVLAEQIENLEAELEFYDLMDASIFDVLIEDYDFNTIDLSFLIVEAYGRI